MLVDSHCHLDELKSPLDEALLAAKNNDVSYFLNPSVTLENFAKVLKISEQYENVVVSLGVHPTEEAECPDINELINLGKNKKVAAIGEVGLDYFYCQEELGRKKQIEIFETNIAAAKILKKPLIIHSREAAKEIINILKATNASDIGGTFHCYTESWEMAKAALDLNFYVSFAGIITFKNADNLREVAKKVPQDKILIETDSPFLAPTPMRGKPNEPAYLKYIAQALANLRHVSYEKIAHQTTENFHRLFT